MANSLNGITGGENTRVSFLNSDGVVLQWTLAQKFSYSQKLDILEKFLMNGDPRNIPIPKGWRGNMTFHRGDNAILNYFIQQEANYYLGGDELPCTIHHTINEINGPPTNLVFSGVVMMLENGGDYNGVDTVEMSVSFEAARLTKA